MNQNVQHRNQPDPAERTIRPSLSGADPLKDGPWSAQISVLLQEARSRSPRDAGTAAYELRDYMEDLLKSAGLRNMDAFALICAVYEAVHGLMEEEKRGAIWDQDGELLSLLQLCAEEWERSVSHATPAEQERMHDWLAAAVPDDTFQLESVLFRGGIWNPELAKRSLELLDRKISTSGVDQLPRLLQYRVDLLTGLGCTRDEIRKEIAPWRSVPEVRRWEIRSAASAGLTDLAMELLTESRETDKDDPALVQEYTLELIELCRKTGQTERERSELTFLLREAIQPDQPFLYWARKLKALTPPREWSALLEELLRRHPDQRLELLDMEGNYAALANTLKERQELPAFLRFESTLRIWNPKRALELYAYLLDREMARSQDPRDCPHLMEHLMRIASDPDGEGIARRLANRWRREFPQRQTLRLSLEQAGL